MSELPQWQKDRLAVLLDACTGAGLTVSAREQDTLSWLAGWEADTVEVIAGLIRRAGESSAAVASLNEQARETLASAGISEADWARANDYPGGRWGGDACGCPDSHCIGHHHDRDDDCGCLPALLAERATKAPEGGA